jgi:hypothetical protein
VYCRLQIKIYNQTSFPLSLPSRFTSPVTSAFYFLPHFHPYKYHIFSFQISPANLSIVLSPPLQTSHPRIQPDNYTGLLLDQIDGNILIISSQSTSQSRLTSSIQVVVLDIHMSTSVSHLFLPVASKPNLTAYRTSHSPPTKPKRSFSRCKKIAATRWQPSQSCILYTTQTMGPQSHIPHPTKTMSLL